MLRRYHRRSNPTRACASCGTPERRANAPWTKTGYGVQTGLFCKFVAPNHKVAVLATYGLQGTRLDMGDFRVLPRGREENSNDIAGTYAEDWDADVVISLYDVWPLNFARLPSWQRRWAAWLPVDHETAPPAVVAALKYANDTIAFSRHGQNALLDAGIEHVRYIPHGVDTDLYSPGDKATARERLSWDNSKFIVGMVATNKFFPSRKSIPQAMAAFAKFHARHKDSMLYMHMTEDTSYKGVDLKELTEFLGMEYNVDVVPASQYDYVLGYPEEVMVNIYRGMDVLLNPSMGEGFGIPIIEALSCDRPVIATHGTAMFELVDGAGWLVEGEPFWTGQGAYQTMPYIGEIDNALEQAYRSSQTGIYRERAMQYDYKTVVAPAWEKYLAEVKA